MPHVPLPIFSPPIAILVAALTAPIGVSPSEPASTSANSVASAIAATAPAPSAVAANPPASTSTPASTSNAPTVPDRPPTQDPNAAKPVDATDDKSTKPAQGQAEKPATLETLVISADRGVPIAYPGGRSVIEPETKNTYPDGGTAALLRRTPGVTVLAENGNDSRINIGLRGNDPRRSGLTTIMVDGIPINEAPYGNTDTDGLPIAFDRIWRTDILRGGASIRYGPNSAGGIVNFMTEPVPDHSILRLGSRIGSDGDYAGSIAVGGTYDRVGVLATGVVKGGDGFRDNGEYQDWDGALKAQYALSDHETLFAYVSRFTELNAEQPGGLSQASYQADPSQSTREGGSFDFDMNRYVIGYHNEISPDSAFEVKTWYQDGTRVLNDFRPILPPFTVTRVQSSEFFSGAIEASYSWATEWGGVKNSWYHSMRYLEEQNDEVYTRTPIAGGPPNLPLELNAKFKGNAFSLFTEDVISLNDQLDWGIGARIESIAMSGNAHDTGNEIVQDYRQFLPETNLTYKVSPETAVYATYQQGFYPPQYETGFDPSSVLYAPTKPEHSEAYEVGVRTHEIEGVQTSFALFDTEFKDKIDFINTSAGIKVPVNVGHARTYGAELGFDYDVGTAASTLDGFDVYGTLTALRSKSLEGVNEGNDTTNSPHWLASWGALYKLPDTGLWGRFGGSYTASAYSNPANTHEGSADGVTGIVPSYVLWDAAVGWSPHPDHSGWGVSVGMTNIFDNEYYRRFSTGIFPGAPQQVFATVGYTISL